MRQEKWTPPETITRAKVFNENAPRGVFLEHATIVASRILAFFSTYFERLSRTIGRS